LWKLIPSGATTPSATGTGASFTFTAQGNATLSLEVTDDDGSKATDSRLISVSAAPVNQVPSGTVKARTNLATALTSFSVSDADAGNSDGDDAADIVCGAGVGGGPNVTIFSGKDGVRLASFFVFDPGFTGGIYVAAGDLTGDARADVICGAGVGGGPDVAVFNGADFTRLLSFFPYDAAFTGGVRVAVGDRNNDGRIDIVTSAGAGGGTDVGAFDGLTGTNIDRFFAQDADFTGGLYVAAKP
jgi:hypothetical protein